MTPTPFKLGPLIFIYGLLILGLGAVGALLGGFSDPPRKLVLFPVGVGLVFLAKRRSKNFTFAQVEVPELSLDASTTFYPNRQGGRFFLTLFLPPPLVLFAFEVISFFSLAVSLFLIGALFGVGRIANSFRFLRIGPQAIVQGRMHRPLTIPWRFVEELRVFTVEVDDHETEVLGVRVSAAGRQTIDAIGYDRSNLDFRIDALNFNPHRLAQALNDYREGLKQLQASEASKS